MNVSVNLATRPFVELRPLLARLKLAMIALALLATGLILGLRLLKNKADVATAQMDALKSQTAEYQSRMLSNEMRMKQPQNKAVLERAQFLNELFAKKSFSWTAVMMDLENVLPAGRAGDEHRSSDQQGWRGDDPAAGDGCSREGGGAGAEPREVEAVPFAEALERVASGEPAGKQRFGAAACRHSGRGTVRHSERVQSAFSRGDEADASVGEVSRQVWRGRSGSASGEEENGCSTFAWSTSGACTPGRCAMSARIDAVTVKQPRFGGALGRRANVAVVAEKTRGALTALNLHFAGVAVLLLLNVYLLVHMAYLWQTARSQDADAVAQQRIQLKTAQIAAAPLEGLDGKLTRSTGDADDFYQRRLPYAYSQAYSELGRLATKYNAKLTRVSYAYTPLYLNGTQSAAQDPSLTEIRMDASLTGDYKPLVQLINELERDKTFFLISAVTLTGQQSGTVSLRLKVTSYLRPVKGDEKAEPLPAESGDAEDAPSAAGAGGSAQ